VQELTLKIIGQIDIKHILTSPIKTITPVLKILTYITGVHPAGAPPKIGKNMIFWRKIVIFHTKLTIKYRIRVVLKIETDIIASITTSVTGQVVILVIMQGRIQDFKLGGRT
jgi:hypothetical protein